MKTYPHLFDQICTFENLYHAYRKARLGKRDRDAVAQFEYNVEGELLRLHEELGAGTYRPGPYRSFYIYEPKKRLISAAPFRDRVVHHALCNVIEPIFDRTFIHDSYACRSGKGTHRAVDRLTTFCRKSRHVLKCDIVQYFPSIDHDILYERIARTITDPQTRWLVRLIIDASGKQVAARALTPHPTGLPIGNLTSQFFANIYLNGLDHFVKETLCCRYYIRYVDDFVVLDDEKTRLHTVKDEIACYLLTLRLQLHPTKCQVFPVRDGIDFLGYRVFPAYRLLRRDNVRRACHRFHRLCEAYRIGEVDLDRVRQSVMSWVAHASHADTYHLRRKLLGEMVFTRSSI